MTSSSLFWNVGRFGSDGINVVKIIPYSIERQLAAASEVPVFDFPIDLGQDVRRDAELDRVHGHGVISVSEVVNSFSTCRLLASNYYIWRLPIWCV